MCCDWERLLCNVIWAQLGDTEEQISLSDKVSYFVENTLSASPLMKVVWLGMFTVILLTMFAFLYTAGTAHILQ